MTLNTFLMILLFIASLLIIVFTIFEVVVLNLYDSVPMGRKVIFVSVIISAVFTVQQFLTIKRRN